MTREEKNREQKKIDAIVPITIQEIPKKVVVIPPKPKDPPPPKKRLKKVLLILFLFFLIITGILLYSRYIGTSGLTVKEYKISSSKLPESFHGFKVVHLSDIHYGRTIHQKELQRIVDEVNDLKPDLVVLTGDLIDKNTKLDATMEKEISDTLGSIVTTIGAYAIQGNHDYQFKSLAKIIENAHFINLNDRDTLIYRNGNMPIFLAGLSTNLYGTKSLEDKMVPILNDLTIENKTETTPEQQENSTPNKVIPDYRILLLHEPDFIDQIDLNQFDLVLSGHSHNGQVRLPLIGAVYTPPGAKKYYREYYKIDNTDLYISSGIGVSTVNFRWFNRPSLNFYRFVVEK